MTPRTAAGRALPPEMYHAQIEEILNTRGQDYLTEGDIRWLLEERNRLLIAVAETRAAERERIRAAIQRAGLWTSTNFAAILDGDDAPVRPATTLPDPGRRTPNP